MLKSLEIIDLFSLQDTTQYRQEHKPLRISRVLEIKLDAIRQTKVVALNDCSDAAEHVLVQM